MTKFENLNDTYIRLVEELENDNFEVEQEVFDLEQQVKEELEINYWNEQEQQLFKELLKNINSLKKEFDFYDEETELDNMFLDRHDADFDEDSISPNSVFGDE